MSRVATTNYGAETDTQFQWATTDGDFFDRELDIFRLSRAVELHDHSSGRGLPIARVAAGAVDAAGLAALAVQTTQINDLAVTNAKLGAGVVTRDKITFPLIQPTNDMAGGFRIRETSNTYAFGFYMALNGLAVLGAGTTGAIASGLIMGQTGIVSVGPVQGAGRLNLIQIANVVSNGFRVYHSNQVNYFEWFCDASARAVLAGTAGTSFMHFNPTNGYMTLGPTATDAARIHLVQQSDAAAEGIRWTIAGSVGQLYSVSEGSMFWSATGRTVQLDYTNVALTPSADQGLNLGVNGKRWAQLWCTAANILGAIVMSGALSGVTSITMAGALSGVTNMTLSGSLGGGTSGTFSGLLVCAGIRATSDNATDCGDTSQRWRYGHFASGVGIGLGGAPGAQLQLGADSAMKPSTNTWTVTSDIRVKVKSSIHNYTGGLEQILALKPVHYRTNGLGGTEEMKPDRDSLIGFIADDVLPIAPEMVSRHKTLLNPKDKKLTEILGLNTHALPFMLVNAVKDLVKRIEYLEKELEDRKN